MFRAGDMNNGSTTHTPEANPQKNALDTNCSRHFYKAGRNRAQGYIQKSSEMTIHFRA